MHVSLPALRRALSLLWRPTAAALVLAASLAAVLTAGPPAGAEPHAFAEPIFSADARGDIVTIGNVTTTCDPTYRNANWTAAESAAACNGATSGATGLTNFEGDPMALTNNRFSMVDVDVDGDRATFNSSSARLSMPAGSTVLWAGLHWNAATAVPLNPVAAGSDFQAAPRRVDDRFRVRLTTPAGGAARVLDAAPADGTARDAWDDTEPGGTTTYGGYVDVTDLVRAGGPGSYTVADVQSCQGFGGCFGSWSLTVAVANPSMPARNLNVWHGWQRTSPDRNGGTQAFTLNGLTPPPRGPVSARIGVVQADGDRGTGPDSLELSSQSAPAWKPFTTIDRPLAAGEHDWFNSTVNAYGLRRPDADASPNLLANLDQDIALVEDHTVIGNDDRTVSFRIKTAGNEVLYSQVVHSAIDIYEPQLAITKTVEPAGPVHTGDEVTWTVKLANAGIDPVRKAIVTDPLPAGTTYVTGSVRYASGGPVGILGPKSDAAGDDQADWDPASRTLTFRAGAGADAHRGGTMGLAPAPDGSHELTITFRTTVDTVPGTQLTNVARGHGEGRELDDPYGPLVTEAEDPASVATIPEADLGIVKTDGDAIIRAVGDRFTYGLTISNAGPSPATGVHATDHLDPRLKFVDSDTGCTATGQTVTCPVGDLAKDATVERTFVVEVVELAGPGHVIPNLATVHGDQHDPDCTGATPKARCNDDDEETPQPAVDLGITKSDGGAVVRKVGDEIPYRLEVTNAGPDAATAVTITDELDPHLAFGRSGACRADGQVVTCAIGDLDAGASVTVAFTATVTELPEPGRAIPNVASVRGAEPDPDCAAATPKARCNHDDEHTPRPKLRPVPSTTTSAPPAPASHPAPPAPARRSALPHTGIGIAALAVMGGTSAAVGSLVLLGRRRHLTA